MLCMHVDINLQPAQGPSTESSLSTNYGQHQTGYHSVLIEVSSICTMHKASINWQHQHMVKQPERSNTQSCKQCNLTLMPLNALGGFTPYL
jgi:hypothetical protein